MQRVLGLMIIQRRSTLLVILTMLLLTISACSGKPRPPSFETKFEHSSLSDVEIRRAELQCNQEAQDDSLSYYQRLPLGYCPPSSFQSICRSNDANNRQDQKRRRYKNTYESCILSFGFKPVKVCVKNCKDIDN